jgi:hypothetical protein
MVLLVLHDATGRIWFEQPDDLDLWRLPVFPLQMAAGVTPGEVASYLASKCGAAITELAPIGGFRGGDTDPLYLSYRALMADRREHEARGLMLPLELAPLNTDPQHMAIVSMGRRRSQPLDERLVSPNGADHLQRLRANERIPVSPAAPLEPFIDILRNRIARAEPERSAPLLARLGELLALDGQLEKAHGHFSRAAEIAERNADLGTVVRCHIRLEELRAPAAGESAAWDSVARLTEAGGRRHLDIPFAYLGAFATRRHRHREADVYLRRALTLCDELDRRAALRRAITLGSTPQPARTAS